MKCRHRKRESLDRLIYATVDGDVRAVWMPFVRCVNCHHFLSLGPANDEPEAVKIEIRAAEIADEIRRVTEQRAHEWAGYLAACIASHDAERGG